MGNQRQYNPAGGFSEYLYERNPNWDTFEYNDVKAKVIRDVTDPEGMHTRLPTFADTSDVYLRTNADGVVTQACVYKNRAPLLNFDWDHAHRNTKGDKQFFPEGVVHVQTYSVGSDGKIKRQSMQARLMTDEEIAKFGPMQKSSFVV